MVFTVNAAERLKYYLMCSVKKPIRWSIRMHISRMEALNKYLGILPTIKNSPLAVASTEMGNVPFTEATHGMVHAWVGQKLLKKYIFKSFLMSEVELETLFQRVQTQYGNHSSRSYSVS